MPCDPEKIKKVDALLDSWLDMRARYPDDDEDDCDINPLDAPPSAPFYSDGPPEKIHGEGKTDQEQRIESIWGPRPPKPPIPIEHL